MGWTVGGDLGAHRRAVATFLAADPVGVTGQATLLAALAAGARWSDTPPVFCVHRDPDGRVDGAAVRTPPRPLHLDGAGDPAELVAALAGHDLTAVNGPEPLARAFAAAWAPGRATTVQEHERLHLLALGGPDRLVPPPARAAARPATADDLPRLWELHTAMRAEIGETGPTPTTVLPARSAAGLLWVVDHDGRPVATANASEPVAGVSRVAGVFTAPEHRGRGLAAVVTAAVTGAAFAAGADQVCLYTQASNPVSNGVYERLGFRRRPVDRLVLRFGTG